MKIVYLVNQYPTVSHSFIRREILALEALGISITRFSHRSCAGKVVDRVDKQELEKTNVILDVGAVGLVANLLLVAVLRPKRWLHALQLTFNLGRSAESWLPDRPILRHLAYLAEACVLWRWLSPLEVDRVHAHFGTYSTTVALLCYALGGPPYSFTVHGPEEFDNVGGISLSEKIKQADFVIAISSFGCSQLYRWCQHAEWPKIHQIRCGLDEGFLSQPWQPIADRPHFVCVARLSEQKGHLLLIEAVSQLVAEGLTLKLVLMGDGPLREQIAAAIARLGLESTIEMKGWATEAEVKEQILASRAMVLPSLAEGLPVVIMESLALGRPAISTYIAGIPELLEHGVTGWLIPAGDVAALAATMRLVLHAPIERLEEMGKRGAERVARQHNIRQEAQKLADLLASSITKTIDVANNIK